MPFKNCAAQKLTDDQLKQRLQQADLFPNQISLGSFTPHSTIVEVGCFRTQQVVDAVKTGQLLPVRQDIQVLCHEMTHWFDFFGTVWGREYIHLICKGYRAVDSRREDEFPRVVQLFDQDRRVLAPSYYRYTSPPSTPHSINKPWTIEYLTGVEIDAMGSIREDQPIFMAKFGENGSGKNFARQPISIGALLEVRAIASEITAMNMVIETHPDADEKIVERGLAKKEFSDLAYDHELVEYNTAMHILSVQSGSSEFSTTAQLAAVLAFYSLNLNKYDFDKLKHPSDFEIWGKRNKAFKKNKDRGYAFACMVFNGGHFDGDVDKYICKCLSASNLGTKEGILQRAKAALSNKLRISNGNSATEHFVRESEFGPEILDIHMGLPFHTLALSTLTSELLNICPPFVDSNADFIQFSGGRSLECDLSELHDDSHKLNEYTRNLLRGCRGV